MTVNNVLQSLPSNYFKDLKWNIGMAFFSIVSQLCILPTCEQKISFLFFQVTHQVLLSSNVSGQTLLTLIEVNRESLSESLPLVLKREYGCHRRDMRRTELCLSEQLETSASASEIIVVRILNLKGSFKVPNKYVAFLLYHPYLFFHLTNFKKVPIYMFILNPRLFRNLQY